MRYCRPADRNDSSCLHSRKARRKSTALRRTVNRPYSLTIARIGVVEDAQIGGPSGAAPAAIVVLELLGDLGTGLRRNFQEFVAGRFHLQLDVGGGEQIFHQHECLTCGLTDCEHAVMLHDQRAVLPKCLVNARALVEVLGDAFIFVIAWMSLSPEFVRVYHGARAWPYRPISIENVAMSKPIPIRMGGYGPPTPGFT